jgi:hypothetical protein
MLLVTRGANSMLRVQLSTPPRRRGIRYASLSRTRGPSWRPTDLDLVDRSNAGRATGYSPEVVHSTVSRTYCPGATRAGTIISASVFGFACRRTWRENAGNCACSAAPWRSRFGSFSTSEEQVRGDGVSVQLQVDHHSISQGGGGPAGSLTHAQREKSEILRLPRRSSAPEAVANLYEMRAARCPESTSGNEQDVRWGLAEPLGVAASDVRETQRPVGVRHRCPADNPKLTGVQNGTGSAGSASDSPPT